MTCSIVCSRQFDGKAVKCIHFKFGMQLYIFECYGTGQLVYFNSTNCFYLVHNPINVELISCITICLFYYETGQGTWYIFLVI